MRRREIAELACKVLALWCFAQGVLFANDIIRAVAASFRSAVGSGRSPEYGVIDAVISCMPAFAVIGLGVVFWFAASRLAGWMVSGEGEAVTSEGVGAEQVLSIALVVLGVYFLVVGLEGVSGGLASYILRSDGTGGRRMQVLGGSQFWSSLVVLAVAVWLILGSRGLARFIVRMRGAGVDVAKAEGAG